MSEMSDSSEKASDKYEAPTEEQPEEGASSPSRWDRVARFYEDNEFLIHVVCAILLAKAYPPLGATYLAPEITATWLAVCFIFLLAGLGLKTQEFSKAFQRLYFNAYVQIFNFGAASAIVYAVSRGLKAAGALSTDLADGMVICASLPMTINMVLVLTKSANGDEAAAIFNAAFGNLVGVFLVRPPHQHPRVMPPWRPEASSRAPRITTLFLTRILSISW